MKNYNEIKLLRNINISLVLLFLSFSILIIFIIYNNHLQQKEYEKRKMQENYIQLHKKLIKKEVVKIYNLIHFQYEENKTTYHLPIHLLQKYILQLIESITYDKNGYIFIVNHQGDFLINIKKSLLAKNQLNLKDKNGKQLTKLIINTAQKGDGYISYIAISGTHNIQTEKISYIKNFKPWNWAIGYGFHPSDIQKDIDQKIKELDQKYQRYFFNIVITVILVTIFLITILLFLSKKIKNLFIEYKKRISLAEYDNQKQTEIIYHQSKMVIMGELINMISHQWRQPLTQINSITMELYIEQKNNSLDKKSLAQHISNIENTTQYLSQTIDDFSNFFVPETETDIFLTCNAIDHCLKIIDPSIKHVEINKNYRSDHFVHGYITLFQQIILSLITNSIEIFNYKNIKNPTINISTYDTKHSSVTEIIDNGGGVTTSQLNKIFDLYFSTKTKKTSKGLGLYIAKKIITQHFNGTILASNVQDGLKFTIKVPIDAKK